MLYKYRFLGIGEELPTRKTVSAVFLIAFSDRKILSVRNERGWDIPGGHLEGDEDFLHGLRREVREEAGALVKEAKPYGILSSASSPKVMLFFASDSLSLGAFVPSEDAFERDLLEQEDLLSRYYGDRELLRAMIEEAARRLK